MKNLTHNKLAVAVILLVLIFGFYYYLNGTPSVVPNQASRPSMKINVEAVCQGALAYMTFSSGAESDAFVTECKEGKHPEVIEKYIKSLNLDDGKAI